MLGAVGLVGLRLVVSGFWALCPRGTIASLPAFPAAKELAQALRHTLAESPSKAGWLKRDLIVPRGQSAQKPSNLAQLISRQLAQ